MHMTPMSYIYILVDPRSQQPRYVGKTSTSLERRLAEHLGRARKNNASHRDNWIRQLLALDLEPSIEAVESGLWTRDNTNLREKYWIANLQQLGAKLTNMTAGGDGGAMTFTSEQIAKIGAATRHNWTLEEYRNNLVSKMADYWATNDRARAAVARQASERWADPEFSARKTLQSPEYRARRSAIAKDISSRVRKCADCDRVSNPQNMGRHLKHSGHSGYVVMSGGE